MVSGRRWALYIYFFLFFKRRKNTKSCPLFCKAPMGPPVEEPERTLKSRGKILYSWAPDCSEMDSSLGPYVVRGAVLRLNCDHRHTATVLTPLPPPSAPPCRSLVQISLARVPRPARHARHAAPPHSPPTNAIQHPGFTLCGACNSTLTHTRSTLDQHVFHAKKMRCVPVTLPRQTGQRSEILCQREIEKRRGRHQTIH